MVVVAVVEAQSAGAVVVLSNLTELRLLKDN